MKKLLTTSLSLICLQTLPLTLHADTSNTELNAQEKKILVNEAKTQIMALGGALMATLKQGIQANEIVLGLKHPQFRTYTDFATA